MRGNECKCSSTVPVTAVRNHSWQTKEIFQCRITVMTLYCIYVVICIPDESLSRPYFTSRRIEGWLLNLEHRRIGENFVPYVTRIEKRKEKLASQTICIISFILKISSHVFHYPSSVLFSYTFLLVIYSKLFVLSHLYSMSHPFH